MNSQQLQEEIFEKYSEWLEHDSDNSVMLQIVLGLLLREKNLNEDLRMKIKRLEMMYR